MQRLMLLNCNILMWNKLVGGLLSLMWKKISHSFPPHCSWRALVQALALLSSISAPRNSPRHQDQGRCSHLGAHLHPDVFAFGLDVERCPVGYCYWFSAGTPNCYRAMPSSSLFHVHTTNSFFDVASAHLRGTIETQRSGIFAK